MSRKLHSQLLLRCGVSMNSSDSHDHGMWESCNCQALDWPDDHAGNEDSTLLETRYTTQTNPEKSIAVKIATELTNLEEALVSVLSVPPNSGHFLGYCLLQREGPKRCVNGESKSPALSNGARHILRSGDLSHWDAPATRYPHVHPHHPLLCS
jgi:hypothetical protein